jgi:hypothetical protein
MHMRYLLPCCLMLSLALPAMAQVYKYTDAAGNVVFSDQPPDGVKAEQVNVPPPNTVSAPAPSAQPPSAESAEPRAARAPYSRLELTGLPEEGGALRANSGDFSVGVTLQPPLMPGHGLRLMMDGQPYAENASASGFVLNEIDRGQHSLVVEVVANDQVIQRSDEYVFTVQRVSVNSPARGAP